MPKLNQIVAIEKGIKNQQNQVIEELKRKVAFLEGAVGALRDRLSEHDRELRELRALVTPLDPGSLPPSSADSEKA